MSANVGIIGYGGSEQLIYSGWNQVANVHIVAVSDGISKFASGNNVKFYESWEKLLQDKAVDIVWIATPPRMHASIVSQAVQTGKDFVIEKPSSGNPNNFNQLIEVHKQAEQIATLDYMLRFDPACQCLANFSADCLFGELWDFSFEGFAQDLDLPKEHWFWNKDIKKGLLSEQAAYFIDRICCLASQKNETTTGQPLKQNTNQQPQTLSSILSDKNLIATHCHSFSWPGFVVHPSIELHMIWLTLIFKNGYRFLVGSVFEPKKRHRQNHIYWQKICT